MAPTTETTPETVVQVGDWVVCHNHEGIPYRGFHVLRITRVRFCEGDVPLALVCWEERDAFAPYSGRRYGEGETSIVRLERIQEVWRKTRIVEEKGFSFLVPPENKVTLYLGKFPVERWEWVKVSP